MDSKRDDQLSHNSLQPSGNGRISSRSDDGDAVSELRNGIEGTELNNHVVPSETVSFVNNNDTFKPNTQHEIVNNRREAQLMFVNSDRKLENEESF